MLRVSVASCVPYKVITIQCDSQKCSKTELFAYGQTEPIEVLGTFEAEIRCEDSAKSCLDGLTVLHINKNVKPVAQPVRRLPFGLTL